MTEKVEVQQREGTDRGKKGNFYSSCSSLIIDLTEMTKNTIFSMTKGHNSFILQAIYFKLAEPHCTIVLNIYTKFH